MWIQEKVCDRCLKKIYGSREREADGYRTWWDSHYCVKQRYRYSMDTKSFKKVI